MVDNLKNGIIYTHDEAAKILDRIDDILVRYGVRVPSPEDEDGDRGEYEDGLYGSTYDELLAIIEERIKAIVKAARNENCVVIPDKFSGDY